MDVYGDNKGIIADCVDEIQPFIDEVMPENEANNQLETEDMDIVIPVEEYLQ